jgi:MYXO-CTERM domain-containing protein
MQPSGAWVGFLFEVEVGMMRSVGTAALLIACVASCGPGGPQSDLVSTSSSAIQGGTTDTTHNFAVGLVQFAQEQQDMVAFCSGVLLAPNLVATARHCVAALSSTTIDCSSSTFGALYPASGVFVTAQPTISMKGLVHVSNIIVPSEPSQTAVCGNDIALMILSDNIELPQYVEPVIDPPMTDTQYEHVVTAIGYGVDTPTDTAGTSAGIRRIKENVDLLCIPDDANDPSFDCFNDPTAKQVLTAGEFVSGDSTCEGDSGSGAFEQGNFNNGEWVGFGVLSRGGVSQDGATCEQPIYTRFDTWGSLIIGAAQQAATQAAAQGQSYSLAQWAGGSGALQTDAGASVTGASSGVAAGSSSTVEPNDAASCGATGDCASAPPSTGSGGCTVAAAGSPDAASWRFPALFALGFAGIGLRRRRR